LNEWRNGFAATAMMIVATFFIQDPNFHDATQCEEFAAAMLNQNRYLFNESDGNDNKVCP